LAAVTFQVYIRFLYENGILRLSHAPILVFLVGSFLMVGVTSGVSGWLLSMFCPQAAGSGIPQLKVSFWKDFGLVPWRVLWVKFIGGVLSVGGGASLGREGPSVQLGGGIASNIGGMLGEPKQQRRPAVAAGAAAGLAAAFNTPIAAVTFVLEEIIGDLNSRLLGGVLLASVVGALVVHGLLGEQPAFALKAIASPTAWVFAVTPVVALLASIAGCPAPPQLMPAPTCRREATVRDAQTLLIESPAGMVVIVAGVDGRVIGLVTLHDLLRAEFALTSLG